MNSLKKMKGFTIVELLIVIVVIGILATLVIVTFTGVQEKARDSQRQTDINALDSHLAAFYATYGAYPTVAQLQAGTWVSTYMKGLDPAALLAPNSTTPISAAASTKDKYQYAPTEDDGTTACSGGDTTTTGTSPNVDTLCTKFTLRAVLEAGGSFDKSSNT